MANTDNLEIEVAWMHYISGLSQAEIADRRGLSRMRVHRLIQAAQDKGYIKIFVDSFPDHCLALEEQLIQRYGLTSCKVVPVVDNGTMFDSIELVGSAAALFLHGKLESTAERSIGIGSGRTIAAMARALPAIRRPNTTFVSITGDFAALNAANPFEVINTLVNKTEGVGFALTAPLILESREDRDLFLKQTAVQRTLARAETAEFFLIGLGHLGSHSYLGSYDLILRDEEGNLIRKGVVADLAGHLLDQNGKPVEGELADRMLSMRRDVLMEKPTFAVCSGCEKAHALLAALRSGMLNGVIASEDLVRAVLDLDA